MRTPPRDKTEAAVQALMDLDVRYAHHSVIADALRTILPDLPPLPEGWDGEDGESGRPEQYAQNVARLFLDAHDNRGADDPFGVVFQLTGRLDRIQERALKSAALDAVGKIAGYKVAAKIETVSPDDDTRVARIHLYEEWASVDLHAPLAVLPPHATRREVLIATDALERGLRRGLAAGQRDARNEMKRIRAEIQEVFEACVGDD